MFCRIPATGQSRWLDQEAMLAMLDDREAILDCREAICIPSKYLVTSENDFRLSEAVTIIFYHRLDYF